MAWSAKGRRENKAEDIAGAAIKKEQALADQMQQELQQRKSALGEWTQTGGFQPGEAEQFLRRGTAPVAAMYGRITDTLNRQRALQGGYMPGYTASIARAGRQAAQQGAEASLGANVALTGQRRAGQQFGYQALSDVDINQLRNRLQAGQLTMQDAELLAKIASQDKSLLENIKGWAGLAGGAIAGSGIGGGWGTFGKVLGGAGGNG